MFTFIIIIDRWSMNTNNNLSVTLIFPHNTSSYPLDVFDVGKEKVLKPEEREIIH